MLYIYISLFISLILCLTGLVLSFVNLRRYNFGLYLALVAIVGFTVALAFFVVKPKACLGPKWFSRVFRPRRRESSTAAAMMGRCQRRSTTTQIHFDGGGTTTIQGPHNRVMFFGFNTAAFFHQTQQIPAESTTRGGGGGRGVSSIVVGARRGTEDAGSTRGSSGIVGPPGGANRRATIPIRRGTVDPPLSGGGVHFDFGPSGTSSDARFTNVEINSSNIDGELDVASPSIAPSADRPIDEASTSAKDPTRVRAWTFTCSTTTSSPKYDIDNGNDSVSSDSIDWRQLHERLLIRENHPTTLLRSSFPLSERTPPQQQPPPTSSTIRPRLRSEDHCNSTTIAAAASNNSWSTEEVVNLDEFLNNRSNSRQQNRRPAADQSRNTARAAAAAHSFSSSSSSTLSASSSQIFDENTPPPEDPRPTRPARKYALAGHGGNPTTGASAGHSWRRSHTVTVKYVAVKDEWISKPLAAAMEGRSAIGMIYPMMRKKSKSSNAVFVLNQPKNTTAGGENSPWWTSVTSLFRRGSNNPMSSRNDANV